MAAAPPTPSQIVYHKDLPTLPHFYAKLVEACHGADVSLSKIVDIVHLDPALSHKVMTLASKVKFRQAPIIDGVEEAVKIIGLDMMRAVISHALTRQVFDTDGTDSIKELSFFWQHAIACAYAGELIAGEINYPDPREAFLSGLLHDIGKLVLLTHYPNKYKYLLWQEDADPEHRLAAEKALGFNHAKIGAQLIQTWGHANFIADTVLYHHHSLEGIRNAFPLVQIVYTANLFAASHQENNQRGLKVAQELFDFDTHLVDEICMHMKIKTRESIRFIGLDDSEPGEHASANDFYSGIHHTIQHAVRDVSLLSDVIQNLLGAVDRHEIIREIKQALGVMFDVNDIKLFLYDPQEDALIGQIDGLGDDLAMRIPMQVADCLPVSSLLNKEIVESFSLSSYSKPTILDAQLINHLGTDGMVCVPLIARDIMIGCILLGVDKVIFPFLSKQFHLLELLARKSAAALYVERKQGLKLKETLSQQEKATHTKARKIVHEANNPLGIIKNYLKVLEIKLSEQDMVCDEIRIINEEISRVGVILKGLVSKNGAKSPVIEPVDLNMALSDIARLLGETLKSRGLIEIHLNLDDDLPKAGIDKNSLKQVALNLLKNAAEALPDGGSIHLQTIYVPNGSPDGKQKQNSLGKARILVRDNGPGLSDGVQSRLFEPHVTSKPDHEGLGLSVVKNLIHQLNGSIACESSTDGTCFTIELPL